MRIENISMSKDNERGNIEKNGNMQRNVVAIQDETVAASRTAQTQIIEGKIEYIRFRGPQRITSGISSDNGNVP